MQSAQLVAPFFQGDVEPNQGQDLAAILRHPLAARHFHLRHGKLLQTRQRAEWNRHARIARTGEQQERLFFVRSHDRFRSFAGHAAVAGFRDHAGTLRQPEHVQNERYFAVSHDARAGKCSYRLKLLAQRLDHNFLGIVDLIDDQSEPPVVGSQHHDVDRAVASRCAPRLIGKFELTVEIDQRQQLSAQPVDGRAVNQLDALVHIVGLNPHQFEQTHLGNGVTLARRRSQPAPV